MQSAQVAKFRPNSPKVAKDNNFIAKKKLTTFSLTQKEGQTSHRRKIKKLKEVPKNVLFGQNLLIEALSVCGRANLALGSLLQLLLGKQKRNCA